MGPSDDRHTAPALPPGATWVVDALEEAALLVDARGDVLHANPAAVRRWGPLPAGLTGADLAATLDADAAELSAIAAATGDRDLPAPFALARLEGSAAPVARLSGVVLLRFAATGRGPARSAMVAELADRVELLAEAVGRRQAELERAQSRYGRVIAALHDGLVVHGPDGAVVAANPAACAALGVEEDALRSGTAACAFVHPDGTPWPLEEHPVVRTLADGTPCFDVRMGVHRPDGELRWIDISTRLLEDGGAFAAFVDVTERLARESELHSARERLRMAFEDGPTGLGVVDLDGRWLQVNRALCALLRREEADVLALGFQDVTHPDDVEADLVVLHELLAGTRRSYTAEKRYLPGDGSGPVWVQIDVSLVSDAAGAPDCFVVHVQDISERRRAEDELRHRADHDPLTGLANRACFHEAVGRELQRVRRGGAPASLVMLDLDRFKSVNDRHGHGVGDELMRCVAAALRRRLRSTDLVARLGGDEFAVLLPDTPPGEAEQVAQDLLARVRDVTVPAGRLEIGITASAGVVELDASSAGPQDDLVLADLAMYEAKASGRDRAARARTQLPAPVAPDLAR